jgi:hypothetical protein
MARSISPTLEVGARHEALDRAVDVADVAKAGWKRVGERRGFPTADEDLGVEGGELAGESGVAQAGGIDKLEFGREGAQLAEHGLGEEFPNFGRREDGEN